MDSTTGEGDPPPLATTSPALITHLLAVTDNYAIYFHASSPSPFNTRCVSVPDNFQPGKLYCMRASAERDAIFSDVSDRSRRDYTDRARVSIKGEDAYRLSVLNPLMLAQRLLDYSQSCAIVISPSPAIISVPNKARFIDRACFGTESGDAVDVRIDRVVRGRTRTLLYCTPMYELPESLEEGTRLIYDDTEFASVVTQALERSHRRLRPIGDLELHNRIYGEESSCIHSKVDPTLVEIPGTKIVLNAELSDIVRRYLSPSLAIVVENLQDDEATISWLLTAMACSYYTDGEGGGGTQLFISKKNDTLFDLAYDLDDADECRHMNILHLVSVEKEASLKEHDRSPFSIFNTWNNEEEPQVAAFNELRDQYLKAGKRKRRSLLRDLHPAYAAALKQHPENNYDAVLATMEMALGWLFKPKDPDNPCHIQELLEQRVARVVVLDTHLWTEAEVNALTLSFKSQSHHPLQWVFIGDPLKIPPAFCTYNKKPLPGELDSCSAWGVLKRKNNIPITKIRKEFAPPPPAAIKPHSLYSDQHGPSFDRPRLTTVYHGFINGEDVKRSKRSTRSGSSNSEDEVSPLEVVLAALKESGREQHSGTVIAYKESFQSIAETHNLIDYDILTLDYPDREQDTIVMLWTTNRRGMPVNNHAFFAYPYLPAEAISLHKTAIVLLERTPCEHQGQCGDIAVVAHGLALGYSRQSDRMVGDPTRHAGREEA